MTFAAKNRWKAGKGWKWMAGKFSSSSLFTSSIRRESAVMFLPYHTPLDIHYAVKPPREGGWSRNVLVQGNALSYLDSKSVRMPDYCHVFILSSKPPAYRWGQQMIDTLFSLFFTLSASLKEILEFSPMTFWSCSCSIKNKLKNLPHVSEQELWNLSLPVVSFEYSSISWTKGDVLELPIAWGML